MITMIFAEAIGLTALAFVLDRKEGLMSRMWAAGVVPLEMVLAHTISQLFISTVQATIMLIFALLVFSIPLAGNLMLVVIELEHDLIILLIDG